MPPTSSPLKSPAEIAPIHLPPFTRIGATTDEWGSSRRFRRRFRYWLYLQRLSG